MKTCLPHSGKFTSAACVPWPACRSRRYVAVCRCRPAHASCSTWEARTGTIPWRCAAVIHNSRRRFWTCPRPWRAPVHPGRREHGRPLRFVAKRYRRRPGPKRVGLRFCLTATASFRCGVQSAVARPDASIRPGGIVAILEVLRPTDPNSAGQTGHCWTYSLPSPVFPGAGH